MLPKERYGLLFLSRQKFAFPRSLSVAIVIILSLLIGRGHCDLKRLNKYVRMAIKRKKIGSF